MQNSMVYITRKDCYMAQMKRNHTKPYINCRDRMRAHWIDIFDRIWVHVDKSFWRQRFTDWIELLFAIFVLLIFLLYMFMRPSSPYKNVYTLLFEFYTCDLLFSNYVHVSVVIVVIILVTCWTIVLGIQNKYSVLIKLSVFCRLHVLGFVPV